MAEKCHKRCQPCLQTSSPNFSRRKLFFLEFLAISIIRNKLPHKENSVSIASNRPCTDPPRMENKRMATTCNPARHVSANRRLAGIHPHDGGDLIMSSALRRANKVARSLRSKSMFKVPQRVFKGFSAAAPARSPESNEVYFRRYTPKHKR